MADDKKFATPQLPNSRAKVALEKGYSQMDWVRIINSMPNPRPKRMSMAEVKKHNKQEDAWLVLHGRFVFDITRYLKFHPGGVPKLMLGAGKDATALFNKYHAWVNYEFLIGKLVVGIIDEEGSTAADEAKDTDSAPVEDMAIAAEAIAASNAALAGGSKAASGVDGSSTPAEPAEEYEDGPAVISDTISVGSGGKD